MYDKRNITQKVVSSTLPGQLLGQCIYVA